MKVPNLTIYHVKSHLQVCNVVSFSFTKLFAYFVGLIDSLSLSLFIINFQKYRTARYKPEPSEGIDDLFLCSSSLIFCPENYTSSIYAYVFTMQWIIFFLFLFFVLEFSIYWEIDNWMPRLKSWLYFVFLAGISEKKSTPSEDVKSEEVKT